MWLNLEQAELLRIQRYNEAWRFYYGKHWIFKREDGEPLVTLNYFRKFIDKHAEFLVSKGFVINVAESMEETTKPYLDEVWKYNSREQLGWDMSISGGVTGDVFVLVTDEEPSEMQRRVNPFSQGKTRINLLGAEQVFPTWDPLNHETLEAARIETIYYAERGMRQLDRDDRVNHEGRQIYTKRFTQIITPFQIVEQFQGQIPTIKSNPLGEIPLIHIKNLSVPKEYYGMSDGHDLIDLQRELNEKATDISDTIHYHSAPITVITGAKAKQLERGPRQIWSGLPEGAQVFNLRLEGDLVAAQNYWNQIKKSIHEIGDIPEGILGQMQPISNTSGVALHQQYGPIVGRRKRKLATYVAGFQQINYFILRIGMIKGRINLPFDVCESCGGRILEVDTNETVPVWNPNAVRADGEQGDYVDVPKRRKICFHIDKQTLDFADPYDMKVKIWRDYGFGGQIIEATLGEAEAIAAGQPSFWDYAQEDRDALDQWKKDVQGVSARNQEATNSFAKTSAQSTPVGEEGQQLPPAGPALEQVPVRPMPTVQKLPMGEVDVPEEPVTVSVSQPLVHPNTGVVLRVVTKDRLLVPTGCKSPKYLNPFDTDVSFIDVLPKDEALQSSLYAGYQQNEWVDPEWVQDRIPEIAIDKRAINKRIKARKTSGEPSTYSNAMVPAPPGGQPITDLTPSAPPQGTVPGAGGNPVQPGQEER